MGFADSGNLRNKDLQILRPGIELACLNSVGFTLRSHKSLLIGRVGRGFHIFRSSSSAKLGSDVFGCSLSRFAISNNSVTILRPPIIFHCHFPDHRLPKVDFFSPVRVTSESAPREVASEAFAKDLIDGISLATSRGADSSAQVEIFSRPPVIHETFSRSAPHIDGADAQV